MKPDSPQNSRGELEAKLTALLLGELSAEEAAEVRAAMEQDAGLAKLYSELENTIGLVREIAASPAPESGGGAIPLRLSAQRRERLQAAFKVSAGPRRARDLKWLIPMSIAAALVALIGSVVLVAPIWKLSERSMVMSTSRSLAEGRELGVKQTDWEERRAASRQDQVAGVAGAVEGSLAAVESDAASLGLGDGSVQQFGISRLKEASAPVFPPQAHSAAGITPETISSLSPDTQPEEVLAKKEAEVALGRSYRVDPNTFSRGIAANQPDDARFGAFGGGGGIGGGGGLPANRLPIDQTGPAASKPQDVKLRTDLYSLGADVLESQKQKVPVLGDTPALGWFFRQEGVVGAQGGTPPTSGPAGQTKDRAETQLSLNRYFDSNGRQAAAPAPVVSNETEAALPSRLMERYAFISTNGLATRGAAPALQRPNAAPLAAKARGEERLETLGRTVKDLGEGAPPEDWQTIGEAGRPLRAPTPAPVPQPEIETSTNPFSTFSLNVSDVSFGLAAASLEKGQMPDPATVRSEEFINAFDYRDPAPPSGSPVGFTWERARYPFAHDRDLLRFSIQTAAAGRQAGVPLNVVLLLDRSGSMERADRVRIVQEALRVLAVQLGTQDKLSVITFARTARLWADGVAGNDAGPVLDSVSSATPEGGTNLEEALRLAYQTARKHFLPRGGNRVVLLTDGAANLGNVNPDALKAQVELHRSQGIALDCFGIGWEGFDDAVLETLSRHGDGRYRFLNTPEEAASGFADQLAGALRVAASDVKVQVEFNPQRVPKYRQMGYAKQQLTEEQFRDNTVDAAEIGAAESGNALYTAQVNPGGEGPLALVRVRYKTPGTSEYREQEWTVPYTGSVAPLEQASASLRLAGTAGAFAEWLASSPYAVEVNPDRLIACLHGVAASYGSDARPRKLESMIQQAKSLKR